MMRAAKPSAPLLAGTCLLLLAVAVVLPLFVGGTQTSALTQGSAPGNWPATYYGPVLAGIGFSPAAGMAVTAWIEGNLCGQSSTMVVEGQVAYTVDVLAEGLGGAEGCGALGRRVTFEVGSQIMEPNVGWDNSQAWELPLRPVPPASTSTPTPTPTATATATRSPAPTQTATSTPHMTPEARVWFPLIMR